MLVHQDDAGQPLLVGIAAQIVGVQRGLAGQGNLVLISRSICWAFSMTRSRLLVIEVSLNRS